LARRNRPYSYPLQRGLFQELLKIVRDRNPPLPASWQLEKHPLARKKIEKPKISSLTKLITRKKLANMIAHCDCKMLSLDREK